MSIEKAKADLEQELKDYEDSSYRNNEEFNRVLKARKILASYIISEVDLIEHMKNLSPK